MVTIQKTRGNFLEDFKPGALLRHKGGKTITEGLHAIFTDFSFAVNPLAKNARYAAVYGYKGLIVPPSLVMNVVFSQTVEDISENARVNLEYIDMRFGVPVYLGDTLEAETKILSVTPSSRHHDRGVVHVQSTGYNHSREVVLTFHRNVQVWKRNLDAPVATGTVEPDRIETSLDLPSYRPDADYRSLAYLTNPDSYFEDFTPVAELRYATGRHTAPIFAGDTVFASTEIKGKRDFPGRADLGVLETILRG